MTAAEIAALVEGDLTGDGGLELASAQALHRARPNQLAFWERRSGQSAMPSTEAGCVIVEPGIEDPRRTLIRCQHPRNAFARALRALVPPAWPNPGVHASAIVDLSATLGEGVHVGPGAVVEASAVVGPGSAIGPNAFLGAGGVLGSRCRLYAGATVHGNARLEDRVVVHSGAVIGADGFGWAFEADRYRKFPQIGGVRISSDVEIGANACVDRGALDDTRIGCGTKLDNLVHIGHNCQIGRHVMMAAQVGLSGGVVVEDYAVLGGQAGVGDRARIRKGVQLGGQGGLLPDKSIGPAGAWWGTPARPLREVLASQALVRRLPRLIKDLASLRRRVRRLETP